MRMAKSHHEKKTSIQGGSFYIVGPKDLFYAHHSLNLSKVSTTQAHWRITESKSAMDWTLLLHVLGGYNEQSG